MREVAYDKQCEWKSDTSLGNYTFSYLVIFIKVPFITMPLLAVLSSTCALSLGEIQYCRGKGFKADLTGENSQIVDPNHTKSKPGTLEGVFEVCEGSAALWRRHLAHDVADDTPNKRWDSLRVSPF